MWRIVHLNTADNEGGAARAAYRLHKGLRSLGLDSKILSMYKVTQDSNAQTVYGNKYYKLADRMTYPVLEWVGLQDLFYPSTLRLLRNEWIKQADIIQLHNLHGRYFSFPFLRLLEKKPLVWYLHDMWPITGHCFYSYECTRWRDHCGDCPQWRNDYLPLKYDTTSIHHKLKVHTYKKLNLSIVAPSKWLYQVAKESKAFSIFRAAHIPYGIDCDFFFPIDKKSCKTMLGVDASKVCVLFSAHVLENNTRKGGTYFLSALQELGEEFKKDLVVMFMGANYPSSQEMPPIDSKYIGYVTNDYLLRIVLSAADVFVMPSLADNLPVSIMESMACGTPTVAFNVGGIPDLVRHMDTGYLARYKDASDLASGLKLILKDEWLRQAMGRRCREVIESEFSVALQAERFRELYEAVLGK
jgi:glycosyltransferase involved in cell wall biosynthesis